jgi:hypothetical protein
MKVIKDGECFFDLSEISTVLNYGYHDGQKSKMNLVKGERTDKIAASEQIYAAACGVEGTNDPREIMAMNVVIDRWTSRMPSMILN